MEKKLKGKTVVLGVTSSIAAYKAADIASKLVKLGADVHVIMTKAATNIITPMTLQTLSRNPVSVDMWSPVTWDPDHISLADRADLFVVAPATANTIAQMAQGLAPDLLSSTYLATLAPVLIAPAMNSKMYAHPATQMNMKVLRERGHTFIDPVEGMLACGYEGVGKLAPVEVIVDSIIEALA